MKIEAEDWPTVSKLLDELLDLPPPVREARIARLSGELDRFRSTLRELLALHANAGTDDFLATLPKLTVGFATELPQMGEGGTSGLRIGPYRLLRELGHGGMAVVWQAERADGQFTRTVALKVPLALHPGRDLAQRFARERDILARLEHPHIARFYDAGVATDGTPYLAMEYVEGQPIDAYADERRLEVRARLSLFRQVLDAVQFAHARLVIHRDLKPSNILVTVEGQVRLLDFGIAKLLGNDDAAVETQLTQVAGRALTPSYASPEQIKGESLTTASDIYSLGVVLYELLTGARPYKLKGDSPAQLEQAIADAEVVRPSSAVTEAAAAARGVPVSKLARTLRGDLDTMLLKALKKDVANRYTTVAAFSEDLQRYAAGEPVLAQPDRLTYRVRKFVERNTLAVASAAAIIAALAVGLGVAMWQANVASDRALIAQREASRASAVQRFLLDIFLSSSQLQSDPVKARQTTARELLDIGAKRVAANLKDAPEAQEEVLDTLADMYAQLELPSEAANLRLQRVAVLKQAYGPRDIRVVDALINYSMDISEPGAEALRLAALTEAGAILDANHDYSSPQRGMLWFEYANLYRYTDIPKMQSFADKAIEFFKDKPDAATSDLVHSYDLAGRARYHLGDPESAETYYHKTLEVIRKREPELSAWLIIPSVELAQAQAARERIGDAEQSFRMALEASRHTNGESGETLQSEVKLGAFLHSTSRREEGRRLLADALKKIGPDSTIPELGYVVPVVSRHNGIAMLAEGRILEASRLLDVDIQDARKHYPASLPLAEGLRFQGAAYVALGRYAEAEKALDEGLRLWTQVTDGKADPATNNPYLLEWARLELARGHARAAIATLAMIAPRRHSRDWPLRVEEAAADILLAQALLEEDRVADAQVSAQKAVEQIQHSSVREYFQTLEAEALLQLGEAQRRAGDLTAATPSLERALKLRATNDDQNSPWLAEAELALAACLFDKGERSRARALIAKARAIHAANPELGEHFKVPLNELSRRLSQS